VIAANTVDVKNGELAQKTSASDAVKTLATQMITDHTSVNAKVNQLASRFGLAPKDNDASRRITSDGNAARAQLEGKTGAEFDRDWVANEIAYHEAVLDLVDTVLIPRATNADLVALLRAVRPTLAQHVDHARTVQRALDRPAPAAIARRVVRHGPRWTLEEPASTLVRLKKLPAKPCRSGHVRRGARVIATHSQPLSPNRRGPVPVARRSL
jgi:putative membrane protein